MHIPSPVIVAAEAVDDTAAYLRLSSDEDLTLVAGLIVTAIEQCEGFCGQILLARSVREELRITGVWQLLRALPVRNITDLVGLAADGAPVDIAATHYALDIDGSGAGWLRVVAPGEAMRARVTYEAGLYDAWGDMSAPLRQGIIRLVAHLYAIRDSADDAGPPAAVAALWRPFRRMRLTLRASA